MLLVWLKKTDFNNKVTEIEGKYLVLVVWLLIQH